MSYRLLDPLSRRRDFRLLEDRSLHRERLFYTLIESDFASDLVKGGQAKSGLGKMLGWGKDTSFMDRVQDTVSMVGVVDPTGLADGANALAYAGRGKFKDAAISAMGMIPYLGDAAKLTKLGKGAKLGARGAKLAKAEKQAAKLGKARQVQRAAAGGGGGLGQMAKQAFGNSRFVRGAKAKVGRALGRQGRTAGKFVTGQGKLRGKAGRLNQRVQDFRKSEIGQRVEKGIKDKFSGGGGQGQPQGSAGSEKPQQQPQQPQQPQPQPQQPQRPAGGPLQRRDKQPQRAEAPAPSGGGSSAGGGSGGGAAPPKPSAGGGGGSSQGPRGATIVPVDAKCPTPKTKSSTHRAGGGKRCNKQTIPRDH